MRLPAPRSLKALTLLFLCFFMFATIATGLTGYIATRASIAQLVDKRITGESDELAGRDGDAPIPVIAARIASEARARDSADLGMVLTDGAGRVVAGNITLRRALPLGYSSVADADGIIGLTHGRALVRTVGGGGHRLTVIGETEPIDNYNAARARLYLLGFGSIVLIVMGGLIGFMVIVSRRAADIRRTVDAIVAGDMARRVPTDGSGSEFDQQALAFNRMLDRIAELMAGLRNVSNDIAHDLRTPLARLRGQLVALARAAEGKEPALSDAAGQAVAQADEILAMFAAMLRIAEVQGGDRRAGFGRLDLAELARDVGATMAAVAADDGDVLTTADRPPMWIEGDRQLLSQALINLIENALRHTPPGAHIHVDVAAAGEGRVALSVTDNGPGIPADQHELALRRFGRLAKDRGSSGHGLGLPLVAAVTRLHAGTLVLEDAAPGLRALLVLPVCGA
ncbi:sensor histidine kinase [Sphingomonas quercus]|uniref:histidine kinase n=1 Tax=Sphingomonas quercus TaxID=2842451 RepID=A0ABS6BER9_9SPHN|nr:HAMP domain-containing sensor histidine kinase [Sphingomonas quercus]MBU3076801.1 HAMP domain-containing histidine kinase [Sphingomonas quercus]